MLAGRNPYRNLCGPRRRPAPGQDALRKRSGRRVRPADLRGEPAENGPSVRVVCGHSTDRPLQNSYKKPYKTLKKPLNISYKPARSISNGQQRGISAKNLPRETKKPG